MMTARLCGALVVSIACATAVANLASAQTAPKPELKATAGFDLMAIDKAAEPCGDFYQYACGTWLKNNPIPPDQAEWGRFSELEERNLAILRGILEKAAMAVARGPDTQKIGDYYASCMDERTIDAKGIAPIEPILERIRSMKTMADLTDVVAALHRTGTDVLFSFGSGQDLKDSESVIAQADQGGIGLPEKDYYFRTDEKAVETRKEYVAHIARMFQLLGSTPGWPSSRPTR